MYSLSHSQGDGVMFEGTCTFRYGGGQYVVKVEHTGHYYHSGCARHTISNERTSNIDDVSTSVDVHWSRIYHEVCAEAERQGYKEIAYREEPSVVAENLKAREYEFDKHGRVI